MTKKSKPISKRTARSAEPQPVPTAEAEPSVALINIRQGERATQIEKYDMRETVCRLFSQGMTARQIGEQLGINHRMVYVYVEAIRNELISTKIEYFTERASAYVDTAFDTLHAQLDLLRDETFLREAEPSRIEQIRKNSDAMARNVALFMAAGIGRPRGASRQTEAARNGDDEQTITGTISSATTSAG